jgi:hypothetical protein
MSPSISKTPNDVPHWEQNLDANSSHCPQNGQFTVGNSVPAGGAPGDIGFSQTVQNAEPSGIWLPQKLHTLSVSIGVVRPPALR